MRKRIEEIAGGMVDCAAPLAEFSVSRIEIEVIEGQDVQGEFKMMSKNRIPLRGKVLPSHPRMECLVEDVEGEEVVVPYQFHSDGLAEGDIVSGEFFVELSRREYSLPFVVSVLGGTKSLVSFAELAQKNWQEARTLFLQPDFLKQVLLPEGKERLFYEGLVQGRHPDLSMEEFLLSCGFKEQILIQADQEEFECLDMTERVRKDISLSKNTWGYVEFLVSSDADFIELEKKRFTTEDFLGSQAELNFYLSPEKMHGGKNFGRIYIKNISQEIVISVCASVKREGERPSNASAIRRLHAKLLTVYVDYRLKKIGTGKWALQTCGIIDKLLELDSDNLWYRLIKAQALFTNGQRQESEWLLKEFKRKQKDQRSSQWGYYMYICTLMEHEELYISRLTEEIRQIYLEHQENPILFWCLLFLRDDYADSSHRKLKDLEKRIMDGDFSPLFYVEAYCLYQKEPYLLSRFGEFELKIFYWAYRQGVLTDALSEQVISVFSERMPYHRLAFLLLEACYEKLKDEHTLSVICGYLIRNQKYGSRFFPWYVLGISEKLRITGLYEAYLQSMDGRSIQEIPQIIQMYFKYNNHLGNRQKSILYVNLIVERSKKPQLFEQHYPAMERFAYEQMEEGNIDDNLAVIYKEVLSRGVYVPQIIDALADVLFVHRLTCFVKDARRVVIFQSQMRKPQEVPIQNGVAYFPLYSNDYAIFIEDAYGIRYNGSAAYQLEKLMHPGKYLRVCMQDPSPKLPYLLYYFANHIGQEVFEEQDLKYFQNVFLSPDVSDRYKASLLPKLFSLLHELNMAGEMEYMLKQVDASQLPAKEKSCVLNLCIKHQLYEQAYQMAGDYGYDLPDTDVGVHLLCHQIHKLAFEEDKTLVLSCADVCLKGFYTEELLEYLCSYYQSSIRRMVTVFKAAKKAGVDVAAYAGRLLSQMLYTEEFLDCADEVYQCLGAGSQKIKEAYFSYFSYCHFVKEQEVPNGFFESMKKWNAGGNECNEICGLALLREFSGQPKLSETERDCAGRLMQRYLFQGTHFAFFKQISESLNYKYQLYDKYFIEYRADTKSQIWLHYAFEGTNKEYTEEMTEVYEGIFVKELILFFGETVTYSISEEKDGRKQTLKSGTLTYEADLNNSQKAGRYGKINEMIAQCEDLGDTDLISNLTQYERLDTLVDKYFTILG